MTQSTNLFSLIETIYPAGPQRESYLNSERRWESPDNPWHGYGRHQDFFVEVDGQQGHATAFIDSRLLERKEHYGLVGRLEATGPQAFQKTLAFAEDWLRQQGCQRVAGPIHWSVWHRHRFFFSGEAPTILEPTNPTWYSEEMQKAGYQPSQEYFSARRKDISGLLGVILPALDHARQSGVEISRLHSEEKESHLHALHDVSVQSFEESPLAVSLSFEEFRYLYQPYLDPAASSLVYIARDHNQLVGYLFVVPDPLRPSVLLMKTVAVAPAYQRRHIAIALAAIAHQEALQAGCTEVEYLLVRTGNNVNAMPYPGVQPIRKFLDYSKDL